MTSGQAVLDSKFLFSISVDACDSWVGRWMKRKARAHRTRPKIMTGMESSRMRRRPMRSM